MKIGAVPVNINYRYVAHELKYLYTNLNMKGLVYGADFEAETQKALAESPNVQLPVQVNGASNAYEALLATGEKDLSDPDRSENDHYILCTGGTTGMPKGVVWTHKAVFMAALGGGGIAFRQGPIQAPEQLGMMVPHGPELRVFAVAPMMHGAAMWSTLIYLFGGFGIVVNDEQAFNPEHIWDIVQRDRANIMSIVGDAMAQPLIQALEKNPGRWNLQGLVSCGSGGAALSEQLQKRLKVFLPPHAVIFNGIGSSETGIVGNGEKPVDGNGMIVIAARPDLAILGDDGQFKTQPGEEGQLIRTGYTPIGYYNDPKKSAETFVTIGGRVWVLSGDRARITEDGSFVMMGRGSQCINTGGEKVFAEEVEEIARHCDAVEDVLVVGLPDERWGNKVVAVVEVAAGHTFDLAAFNEILRGKLSGYKVPKAVYLTDKVKRSPAGKADYPWAKQFATEGTPAV
jgi:fatty-acyl-CoA synthase